MTDAFRILFENAGYTTYVFTSPTDILKGTAPRPDIYILDRQLSGVDGLEVCRFLKSHKESSDVPVIMVSATPHIARLAENAMADGFIEKPFRQRDLLELVEHCLQNAINKKNAG